MPTRGIHPATRSSTRAGDVVAVVVWKRSRAFAGDGDLDDHASVAIDLVAMAGGSRSILEHALSLGRQHLTRDPGDVKSRIGVQLIERALAFAGGERPSPHEIGRRPLLRVAPAAVAT